MAGPIRGQLLGADQLATRARAIATAQTLVEGPPRRRGTPLLHRVKQTRRILADVHQRLASVAAEGLEVGPGGEWLLDNYHVVQEHIREVHESLPASYYRELPEVASGRLAGYPRVYELAIGLISHTEGRLDLENVGLFTGAFQTVQPLRIGELWAVPTMLRLGLIENVRRMALRSVQRLESIEEADRWAAAIERASEQGGPALDAAIEEFRAALPALTPIFISRFLHQVHQTKGAFPPLVRLEAWIAERGGMSVETAATRATQYVALTQVMMANSITSLRAIGHMDWKEFVEDQSVLDGALRVDPSGIYTHMTFSTRDRYRHVVERVSKRTKLPETQVAGAAIELARAAGSGPGEHVGYWLIDDGVADFERATGYRPRLPERLHRWVLRHPDAIYGTGLLVGSALVLAGILALAGEGGVTAWLAIGLLALLPAVDVSLSALNQLVTTLLPPRVLPKLDLSERGIPAELRTAVVTPILFDSVASVEEALEHAEVQFLANHAANLHFAILSDFADSPTETRADDDAILAAAVAGVRELNRRHGGAGGEAFHLLHRPRRWNAQQGVWMGWERKRGKLAEFNRFLRGGAEDAFAAVVGDPTELRRVRYVITLDADTILPPGAAPLLIGALAHPLNQAVYDGERGRVVRGYGILQPRVGVSLPSAHRSTFAAIHSGHPGVDPYTTAISDVYQDLFGEGSYTGKAIYDVDVFEQATHGRFPENTLLSHDLIEGNYARAGLVTEIALYDDYPSRYLTFTRRKHRWIRGDWQLLPWLGVRAPGPDGPERNRLSLLSRWKILDNLRRSTTEIAQLALIFGGWTVLPGSPLRWTLLALAAIAAPWVISLFLALLRPPLDKSWRAYYSAVGADALTSAHQVALAIAFLPHQAWISADAIVRTLWRLLVSRRRLLEWQSAAIAERNVSQASPAPWRPMWPGLALAWLVALAALLIAARDGGHVLPLLFAALPLLAIWTASPVIASSLNAPAVQRQRQLPADGREQATRLARLHWRYFERFVGEDTAWLVPDNYQEDPSPIVALRTSPTNIGLQLLCTVSACDLGFIDREQMTRRLELAFESLDRMERFRGHFYNWYELPTLKVLGPAYTSTVDSGNLAGHLLALRQALLALAEAGSAADGPEGVARGARLRELAERAHAFANAMEFGFLFDETRELFAIGYAHDTHALDASYYDLLASESRLASFVAIAKKDVPFDHWFRLGRTLTRAADATALVSWSGSMFEYLMPSLVMHTTPFTLLDQACAGALRRHVAYGRERGVPWGVSESAYNLRDRHLTYQYRAFGVPDLALKRGLGRDLVVAPYASALALMLDAPVALENLLLLEEKGALGEYGFRDALDYTRPDPEKRFAVVGTYMAHHIGMSMVALANALSGDTWQQRFHADPMVRSVELLLHERVPRRLVLQDTQVTRADEALPAAEMEQPVVREFDQTDLAHPRVALLGRLPYTIMLSHCGGGYSRYENLAVTRWRADATRDATGQFCYLKDVTRGRVWSAAHQPVCAPADMYRAALATDRVGFHRMDGDIETRTEIAIVPEDSAEVRRITLLNHGSEACEVELTSYGEIVLAPPEAERAHPAFANLFVETEWHEWCAAITATRRPRSAKERSLWCVHVVDRGGPERVFGATCETDRARFVGRGRSTRDPVALESDGPLSGTTGSVLDPIFALRVRVWLEAHQSATVAFTTLVADSRKRAFELADRYHEPHSAQRALELAWTSEQVELRELNVSPADATLFQELAGNLLYPTAALRAPHEERMRNLGSQPLLWAQGVSGDWPIVVASIADADGLTTLSELFAAHRYWRRRGMTVDLVIVNEQPSTYLQELHNGIMEAMYASNNLGIDQPGGVFIRRQDMLAPAELLMLRATARIVVRCDGRTLEQVIASGAEPTPRRGSAPAFPPAPIPLAQPAAPADHVAVARADGPREPAPAAAPLLFENGYGGLSPDGDYHVHVRDDRLPPAPWSNVIANPNGGFVVSESGGGFTWAGSSYFYRLTPWHNDPVSDPPGEAIYLRDEITGEVWCPTPAPVRNGGDCAVRHGAGVSSFEREHAGIASTLTLGLAEHESVKLSLLRLINRGATPRRIAVTAYVEWTLGVMREHTQHQVGTRFVPELSALLAHNPFDADFARRVAFLALSEPVSGHTADRREFIGRNGSMADPAALRAPKLSGSAGAGLDPCAALQWSVTLAPGETREIAVLLGAGEDEADARRLIEAYRAADAARAAVERHVAAWHERLAVIGVRTPEPSFDALLNRWTLYQALACRMWARSALYQSSGAYGFRDQLQDVMAFVYAEPSLAREHILRSAARQFAEGDVQHWWHPHSGRGVRTRFSDDLAWLPFVVDHYVRVTGDVSVLDEQVPFLSMRTLEPHEHDVYDQPRVADERASIHEHCMRALRRACTTGEHGLPLIGTGDWNDGMNLVGAEGRGESVWLCWFLVATLRAYADHVAARGDASGAAELRARADAYATAVDAHGWDGEWYRRAYFDDGSPLGSAQSQEARIDSIAQSWSVISGAGDPERRARAMRSLETHLVREDARLLPLLTPPFDESAANPGYIKGYLPGVRENGAQYTHAALWAVLATALQGDGGRAFELFQMINPLTHARTREEVETYKVEPYVVAADVYTAEGQLGRGGWTWYTGSASWMYRVALEAILGFTKRGDTLTIEPRVPASWPGFSIEYRFGSATYAITVEEPARLAGNAEVAIDGRTIDGATIALVDDGARHEVVVRPRARA